MKLHLLIAALAIGLGARAQSLSPTVQATGGGYTAATGGASLSWTLGEPFTETLSAGNTQLTQGMQQPELNILALGEYTPAFSVSVFPNPTAGNVLFRFSEAPQEPLQVTIFDLSGKQVSTTSNAPNLTEKSFSLNLSFLPAGQYTIRLQGSETSFFATYQLQKN